MDYWARSNLDDKLHSIGVKFRCCLECTFIDCYKYNQLNAAIVMHNFGHKYNCEYAFAQGCINKNFEMVKLFLECGVNVNICNKKAKINKHHGVNVLDDSCLEGENQWLIDNCVDIDYDLALIKTCKDEQIVLVKKLYDQ